VHEHPFFFSPFLVCCRPFVFNTYSRTNRGLGKLKNDRSSDDRLLIYQRICQGLIVFPEYLAQSTRDFILQVCVCLCASVSVCACGLGLACVHARVCLRVYMSVWHAIFLSVFVISWVCWICLSPLAFHLSSSPSTPLLAICLLFEPAL
jgi:hypothetical protein